MRKLVKLNRLIISLCMVFAMAITAYGEPMFPKSSLVSQSCGACHKPDTKGSIELIETTRKTPEEWINVLIRMERLNDTNIDPAKFFPLVKELSRDLILTPKEMAAVSYINSDENSQYREVPKNKMQERIFTACARCHTYAKIASNYGTAEHWNEIRNLHLGYYPTVIPQMREMDWYAESKALMEELAKMFPFDSMDYRDWIAKRKDQDLTGTWRVAGYQPGMGYYEGEYAIEPDTSKGADDYRLVKSVRYAGGTTLEMHGTATLYGTYHLRYALAPTPLTGRIEGVFDLDADKMQFEGKWWTLVQDTNAFGNERFVKAGQSAQFIAAFPQALQGGKTGTQKLTLIGAGLPQGLTIEDIQFSDAAIKATRIISSSLSTLVCDVTVGGSGLRTITIQVKGIALENPVAVFDRIDGIRILPHIGRARVSCGAAYPPQGVQFVARGVHFGADGKAGTADDVLLEPVNARWWLEEEKTREGDDDLKYLNTSIANGLYTPITDYGPIAERKQNREGIGIIAVGASFEINGQALKDRALLAVTVPDFITHIK